jgi:hypothetical protein
MVLKICRSYTRKSFNCILFLNRGDPFTNILFIILSTIVVFIILIIEDYDSLRIGDYIANISNSEQLFDLIERERYYPSEVIKRVKLVPRERYRIGIEDPYTKHEKIFSVVYSKDFGIRIRSLVAKVKFKKH